MRRCAGCMESRPKEDLIRIACYEGRLTVDWTGKAKGRGMYLCKDNAECVQKARKKKVFSRNFECAISPEEIDQILKEVERGEDRDEKR